MGRSVSPWPWGAGDDFAIRFKGLGPDGAASRSLTLRDLKAGHHASMLLISISVELVPTVIPRDCLRGCNKVLV
jgi:hypothetical protein